MKQDYKVQKLIELFNDEFGDDYSTVLIGGGEEPFYRPADEQNSKNQIIFTHDYFASALHEVAHWCIAGQERLQQVDYGYWYAPDGRSEEQQRLFESVEIKPQALEWIFSTVVSAPFKVSVDNLSGDSTASHSFKNNIYQQVIHYCNHGLPQRAERFVKALATCYRGDKSCGGNNSYSENGSWQDKVLNPNYYSLQSL